MDSLECVGLHSVRAHILSDEVVGKYNRGLLLKGLPHVAGSVASPSTAVNKLTTIQ